MNPYPCCLQINLSPGDIAYASSLVPHLVRAHPWVDHRLAIVDCQKPQMTRANSEAGRYAEPGFTERCRKIQSLAEEWNRQGLFDRVFVLEDHTEIERKRAWSRKYTAGLVSERRTHDYHGAALTAYWAAMDLPEQRFVLHYDADILLHQEHGYDWALDSMKAWEDLPHVIEATPRTSPPGFLPDAPSQCEGRPLEPCSHGWLNDWFSTRCFLLDRQRLAPYLPLVRGKLIPEILFYRLVQRRYPPAPEILLYRSAGSRGARRLNLGSNKAWFLHPKSKPKEFIELLEPMMTSIAKGAVPPEQIGQTEIQLEVWKEFLRS